ncbi:zinc ribbon domain-containing protein [Clostridium chromiireducens]|uniref:Zinc ribbon domain-containing protein n=1 Tax=Clostridium chromiireducens TaxID=225345 RepID=A0A399IG69_9CLOT|nr:zinc ribbon domain-containing protein [Clostridium chromiireducens]RII31824.1 zinc ribbon domain-containing protein [Clostridium chromiireducens]
MWELIKNDPILKTIAVLLLGVFAFGFVFNIMFGAPQTGMEHGMTQMGGYNLNTTLAYIISLLIKILIIILIIAVIIVAVKFIKNRMINGSIANNESLVELLNKIKSNPLYIIIGALGFLVILMAIMPTQATNNAINNNYSFSILSIIITLVKILLAVSFVGLITGVILHYKQTYVKANASNLVEKKICENCDTELKNDWKACPVCGTEVKDNKNTEDVDTSNSSDLRG